MSPVRLQGMMLRCQNIIHLVRFYLLNVNGVKIFILLRHRHISFFGLDPIDPFRLHCCLIKTSFCKSYSIYEDVSKSFRTGRLERELQMVQLSATRCSCIATL
jgi:hypothetical protein